jgi:hypothetical protein
MTLDEGSVPMTKDRSNVMTLGALGMLSGAVAWALVFLPGVVGLRVWWTVFRVANLSPDWVILSPLSLFPGLVFGFVVGVLLHRRGKVCGVRLAEYVAAAGAVYFCAFHVAWNVYPAFSLTDKDVVGYVISGIAAGIVGSLLLGLMTMLLLQSPGRQVLQLPVLVGGAAGALLGLVAHDHSRWGWTYLAFFVLWQGAYAASLAPLLRPAAISQQGLSH